MQWERGGNMPEIPREISAEPVSQPKMAPGEASQGMGAVAAFGEQMEQSAFYGARQELVLQGAQDRVDASHLESKYRDMYEKKAEGLDQVPYRDIQKYTQQSIDEVTKEFQNDPVAKDNPRLQNLFSSHLEDYSRTFQHATHMRYVKELQQDGYAQYDTEMARYEQDASKIPAGPGRDAIFKEMDSKSQDFIHSHLLNPEIVNRRLQAREKNVQEAHIINLTRSQNPVDIQHGIDVLNAKDSNDTDKIDPEKKAILTAQAEQHLEMVKNKVDNETAMNTALGLMKNNHNDPSLALAALNADTETQKAMGANTYQKTRQLLNDHIEDKDRFEKGEAKKETEKAIQLIVGRKYGEAEKLIQNSKYLKKEGESLTLLNGIRTWRKRTDEDISSHEDRSEYIKINKMIDAGEDPDKIQKEITKTSNLKSPTAYKLLDRLDKNLETDVKHGVSTGNKYLSSMIAPQKGYGIPQSPALTKREADAQEALQTWSLEENKKAVSGKRTPLTAKEIVDHAKELAPHYMMSVADQLKADKEYMKPDKNKPATKYSQTDLEYTAKTHNMTVEQVKKQLGIK
jgi:hypothetical protein